MLSLALALSGALGGFLNTPTQMRAYAATQTVTQSGAKAAATPQAITAASSLKAPDKKLLLQLENEAIKYFLDNQLDNGLILDRQMNFASAAEMAAAKEHPCSVSGTGMGLIAIALASSPNHKIISREDAIARVKKTLLMARLLPQDHGMVPHFFEGSTMKWTGSDMASTIDSAWLIAGGLWAAQYLKDDELKHLANELYDRVDWNYWADKDTTSGAPVLCMGLNDKGGRFKSQWDRVNGEVAFMYFLAIGAKDHALPPSAWKNLKLYNKQVAGQTIASGDLGLFVFEYSNELTDLNAYGGNINLAEEGARGIKANYDACRDLANKFKTYQRFWGLSAGDGPPNAGQTTDAYRAYAPDNDLDGTAHIMATLGAVDIAPAWVLKNVHEAEALKSPKIHGHYGYSNVNLDKNWVSRDVVGIDVGVAVMSLENLLYDNEVRKVWQELPSSKRAMELLSQQ
ncbi:MAG: hypothetical protein JSS83_25170 [Cyanobacteria bacterium SZAS LIN-3]|nr:hypothetical protein [Cyanobacteria bacterium SZAS LIN-3]MBS2005430.1 hypothetical protein [Cyanobacteria bacterium SZAS TMP-1]